MLVKDEAFCSKLRFKSVKVRNDIYFGEKNSAGAVEPAVEI